MLTHTTKTITTLMRKFLFLSIFSLIFTFSLDAQIKKTLHKTYTIGEVENLNFDVLGEYEVMNWAGSTVLVETSIELYDASLNIFKHFLKAGRYNIDLNLEEESAKFISHDKVRRDIKTAKGQCWEVVKYTIRIPEEYLIVDQTTMKRINTTSEISPEEAK